MIRRVFSWFFRNRETGELTVAQAPNLVLWVVIFATALRWIWPSPGSFSSAMIVIVTGGLLVWAADEIVRGVNPWRRCLGAAVAAYEIASVLLRAI